MRFTLTGFGRFRHYTYNPSIIVAEHCARALVDAGLLAEWRELPVDFDAVAQWKRPDVSAEPHALLHIGLAAGRSCVSVETIARNRRGEGAERSDVEGNHTCLSAAEPSVLRIASAFDSWIETLPSHLLLPVERSVDAGDYVCNATLFHSLCVARATPGLYTAFLHVPMLTVEQAEALGRGCAAALSVWSAELGRVR
jgi:pyroglutamyl-peptidase